MICFHKENATHREINLQFIFVTKTSYSSHSKKRISVRKQYAPLFSSITQTWISIVINWYIFLSCLFHKNKGPYFPKYVIGNCSNNVLREIVVFGIVVIWHHFRNVDEFTSSLLAQCLIDLVFCTWIYFIARLN